jgi:hypothetical protein
MKGELPPARGASKSPETVDDLKYMDDTQYRIFL